MNVPKVFFLLTLILFTVIGVMALFKGKKNESGEIIAVDISQPITIPLENEVKAPSTRPGKGADNTAEIIHTDAVVHAVDKDRDAKLPQADRIEDFFRKVEPRFPIVETITYKSKVPWLKGRAAWISDYASHYKTSKHFIARSLNGKKDYFKQDVALGDRFNVFKSDKEVDFYLIVDTSRTKMWFYYHDKGTDERVLVKTYDVGLGRVDSTETSGLLTPLGQYQLGEKVAIYKPTQKGWFNNEKVEMIRVFGTRWIPFECEVKDCTAPAKGFGIHGAPWIEDDSGNLVEDTSCIGKYVSDGCVKLRSSDMEEIFSVVISKPTFIVLVNDFFEVQLPGIVKE